MAKIAALLLISSVIIFGYITFKNISLQFEKEYHYGESINSIYDSDNGDNNY